MTELEKKEEAIAWLELFKVIIRKESSSSITVENLVVNVTNTLNTFINKCK